MALDEDDGRIPDYDKVMADELKRQAGDRQALADAQRLAMADMLESARKSGREALELVELQKSIEERQEKRRQELLQEQRDRRDYLDLLYLGPPSERTEIKIRIALGIEIRER